MHTLALSTDDLALFFEDRHHALAADLRRTLGPGATPLPLGGDALAIGRELGERHGLYAYLVPEAHGGAAIGRAGDPAAIDVRALVLIREALAQRSPLADAIFAVQGLGSYPVALAGTAEQCSRWLPDVLRGRRIGAFALTEPEAGSDVASIRTEAHRDGDRWTITGHKTLISNVPIADHYIVFANANPALGRKGITAFVVEAESPGLSAEPLPMSIPHPIGRLSLDGVVVSDEFRLGEVGRGFALAMETLDAFRISVGAAANGMASHALALTLSHTTTRRQFGGPLTDQQIVKAYLADMATELDAGRLLVARAAHRRDTVGGRVSSEAAMAKMYATEAACRIIDLAVQLHGGMGVVAESPIDALYREIRPLRIYEGATEVQKLIIAKSLIDRARPT